MQRIYLGVFLLLVVSYVSSFLNQFSIFTLLLLLCYVTPYLFISFLSALSSISNVGGNILVWFSGALICSLLVQIFKFFCHCSKSVICFCLYFHYKFWHFFHGCCGFLKEDANPIYSCLGHFHFKQLVFQLQTF